MIHLAFLESNEYYVYYKRGVLICLKCSIEQNKKWLTFKFIHIRFDVKGFGIQPIRASLTHDFVSLDNSLGFYPLALRLSSKSLKLIQEMQLYISKHTKHISNPSESINDIYRIFFRIFPKKIRVLGVRPSGKMLPFLLIVIFNPSLISYFCNYNF